MSRWKIGSTTGAPVGENGTRFCHSRIVSQAPENAARQRGAPEHRVGGEPRKAAGPAAAPTSMGAGPPGPAVRGATAVLVAAVVGAVRSRIVGPHAAQPPRSAAARLPSLELVEEI